MITLARGAASRASVDPRAADRRGPRGGGAAAFAPGSTGRIPGGGHDRAAVALMLVGLFVSVALDRAAAAWRSGSGPLALFLGVAMLAAKLVPPLVRVLGWPATKLGGAPGALARGNAARNPARTASTASALMIGLTLVTLVGVLAAGLRTRFQDSVDQVFRRQLRGHRNRQLHPDRRSPPEQALRRVPGRAGGLRACAPAGAARSARTINVTGVEPDISQVISVELADRKPARRRHSSRATARSCPRATPDAYHLQLGSPLAVADAYRRGAAPERARACSRRRRAARRSAT